MSFSIYYRLLFFFNDTSTTEIYTLSLHDALPIFIHRSLFIIHCSLIMDPCSLFIDNLSLFFVHHSLRSEEHTSELQSQSNLVCRLLLEKKKKNTNQRIHNTMTTIYSFAILTYSIT